ncbi:hypothetical protein KR767_13630 [Luteibacter anthropi]|uniref:hypothetical protein n=1 Tax=Luteibacter anthropi TaxID=564369 RepID=UPI002032CB4C|nr:hypothetical protein [Luteibacter anthropi]URX61123.1 hypothetical protein KR767_13630 [Luteibacter anthropi]
MHGFAYAKGGIAYPSHCDQEWHRQAQGWEAFVIMDVFCRFAFLCVLVVLLQACNDNSQASHPEAGKPAQAQPLEDGNDVARHLQSRYNETMPNCDNNPSGAPTDCSGLLLRATEYSPQYHSWQPNPATAKWGVSFSWLRKDSDFKDTHGTNNGFIVYPEKYALSNGLTPVVVECIYPQDAWTSGPDRCTSHAYSSGSPAPTIPRCQDLKIYTSDEWLKAGYLDNERQCAFDVRPSRSSRATVVMYSVDIRHRSSTTLGYRRNEAVIANWSAMPDAKFPIEAFFYKPDTLPGKPAPLSSAQNDQCDFYRTVGKWIPIIRWDGTALPVGAATFSFRAQDQGSAESCKAPVPNPGEDVARHLQSRYDDTATSCPGQQNPSLVSCSGVLMRVGWGVAWGRNTHGCLDPQTFFLASGSTGCAMTPTLCTCDRL